jgi:RNA polymerase sigma factor (TIGR02999 family)
MSQELSTEVTTLLKTWSEGNEFAQERLWQIVYAELKRLARRYMSRERLDHTLQSGVLVNEAYLRLVDWKNVRWENRAHFFRMSARIMRQILVDHARSRTYQKRGGGGFRVSLDEVTLASDAKGPQLIALDDALKRLAELHPRKNDVVEMRVFGGLSVEETANVLKVSRLTVIRDWTFARAWLLAELAEERADEG